jgi:hypothetical protein
MNETILKPIINQYDFNLLYAKKLVEDVNDDHMTIMPSTGLENHPAWTIGHLVSGSALLAEDLGAKFEMPDNWEDLFMRKGPGDPRKPDPDKSKYPSKELLLNELEQQHNKVKALLKNIYTDKLNENTKWRFSNYMPTLLDVIHFMCVNHEASHLGQLAAWRRAMDLPSALGAL